MQRHVKLDGCLCLYVRVGGCQYVCVCRVCHPYALFLCHQCHTLSFRDVTEHCHGIIVSLGGGGGTPRSKERGNINIVSILARIENRVCMALYHLRFCANHV